MGTVNFHPSDLITVQAQYQHHARRKPPNTRILFLQRQTLSLIDRNTHNDSTEIRNCNLATAVCDLMWLNVAVPIPVLSSIVEHSPLHTSQGVECPPVLWL